MAKKPKFSLEDHVATGRLLYPIREVLVRLVVQIGNAYPVPSKAITQAHAALKAVDDLRRELDKCLFNENPNIEDKATQVYYGKDDSVRTGKVLLKVG